MEASIQGRKNLDFLWFKNKMLEQMGNDQERESRQKWEQEWGHLTGHPRARYARRGALRAGLQLRNL